MALNLTISIFRIQHDQEVDQMHQDVAAKVAQEVDQNPAVHQKLQLLTKFLKSLIVRLRSIHTLNLIIFS